MNAKEQYTDAYRSLGAIEGHLHDISQDGMAIALTSNGSSSFS